MGKLTLKRIVKSIYSLKMYYSLLWHFPFSFPFCLHPSARPFFPLQFYHRLSPHTLSYCSIITFFFSWTDSGLTPLKSTKFSNMPMLCTHCHARLIRPISCCSATQPSGWIFTMKTNCFFVFLALQALRDHCKRHLRMSLESTSSAISLMGEKAVKYSLSQNLRTLTTKSA